MNESKLRERLTSMMEYDYGITLVFDQLSLDFLREWSDRLPINLDEIAWDFIEWDKLSEEDKKKVREFRPK